LFEKEEEGAGSPHHLYLGYEAEEEEEAGGFFFPIFPHNLSTHHNELTAEKEMWMIDFLVKSWLLFLLFPLSILSVSFYEPSIQYPSFSFQNITLSDRHLYLNSSSPSIPCGYMIPTDLDLIRLHYSESYYEKHHCSIVIIRLLFGGYEIFTPESRKYLYLKEQTNLCYILITDQQSLQIPEVAESIFSETYPWTVHVISKLVHPNPAKTMKIIKLSLFRLFPFAKYILYYDVKYHLRGNPITFIEEVEKRMKSLNASFTIFQPEPKKSVLSDFQGAKDRINDLHLKHGLVYNVTGELEDIRNQMKQYSKERFFRQVTRRKGLAVDSAILVLKNEENTHRFFCAWLNEMMFYSRRDQLSFAYLEWKLNISVFKYSHNIQSRFFNKLGHLHPKSNRTILKRNLSNSIKIPQRNSSVSK
jgi:hypothetical protein